MGGPDGDVVFACDLKHFVSCLGVLYCYPTFKSTAGKGLDSLAESWT